MCVCGEVGGGEDGEAGVIDTNHTPYRFIKHGSLRNLKQRAAVYKILKLSCGPFAANFQVYDILADSLKNFNPV